jgi:toxin-antitoxin system PIN domain toxin
MTPDVNVLLAAARGDHPHHAVARAWLEAALRDAPTGTTLSIQPMVIASFLRLVTSPRIFVEPTPIEAAVGFVDALLAAPGVALGTHGPEWPVLRTMCVENGLIGNALPDAWLAAATIEQREHLVSFDRDFARLLGRRSFTRLRPAGSRR